MSQAEGHDQDSAGGAGRKEWLSTATWWFGEGLWNTMTGVKLSWCVQSSSRWGYEYSSSCFLWIITKMTNNYIFIIRITPPPLPLSESQQGGSNPKIRTILRLPWSAKHNGKSEIVGSNTDDSCHLRVPNFSVLVDVLCFLICHCFFCTTGPPCNSESARHQTRNQVSAEPLTTIYTRETISQPNLSKCFPEKSQICPRSHITYGLWLQHSCHHTPAQKRETPSYFFWFLASKQSQGKMQKPQSGRGWDCQNMS